MSERNKSPFDCCGTGLMPVDEAVAALQCLPLAVSTELVPLAQALGRVLAKDVVAGVTVPPFDNSAMDGWAVRCADLGAESTRLPIGGRIAAGHPLAEALKPGHAYRILTGAPLPGGLDTVLIQEDCRTEGEHVWLPAARPGANIRRRGESVALGHLVLTAGTVLKPQHLGVAATLGLAALPVYKQLRVAIFSTGDELRDPGSPLSAGGIYDANRTSLLAMLQGLGCVVSDLGILPDEPKTLRTALREAAPRHDLIVTSGGVSVGDEDHVKAVVQSLGSLHFWRLALRPGKPLLLGQIGDTPFLGLPGNPVSVMVTFLLIGRPLVARLSGAQPPKPRRWILPSTFSLTKEPGRREMARARLIDGEHGPELRLFRNDSSGVLTSMTFADALIDLPAESGDIAPGTLVAFLPFSELMP